MTKLFADTGVNLDAGKKYRLRYDLEADEEFDFSRGGVHHVKLVCENEIVVLYVDDVKALSSRITHSIDGAHIGVFSNGCGASFENITMKLSE